MELAIPRVKMKGGREPGRDLHRCAVVREAIGAEVELYDAIEYFHDHVRIETMLFDGTLSPEDGALRPHLDRPGLGLELKRSELERHAT